MSGHKSLTLSGVSETLLIPLYNRAMESQRPDAIMKDEKAVALMTQMSNDFDPVKEDPDARGKQGSADHAHPRNGPLRPGLPQPSP